MPLPTLPLQLLLVLITKKITHSPKLRRIILSTEQDSSANSATYMLGALGNYFTSLSSFLAMN